MNWTGPQRPAEYTELYLIQAILDGQYPIDSCLPSERDLAQKLGVTRPTLREALQRLERDGWLEIRQGKPTRVRNYWREGQLGVLAAIAQHPSHITAGFPANMLAIRSLLAPTFTRLAVTQAHDLVIGLLEPLQDLADNALVFTDCDWNLQIELTRLSGNPVFTLIYNSFTRLYQVLGVIYFQNPAHRKHSQQFYRDLLRLANAQDAEGAGELVQQVMDATQQMWNEVKL